MSGAWGHTVTTSLIYRPASEHLTEDYTVIMDNVLFVQQKVLKSSTMYESYCKL